MKQRISTNLAVSLCALLLFAEVAFAQRKGVGFPLRQQSSPQHASSSFMIFGGTGEFPPYSNPLNREPPPSGKTRLPTFNLGPDVSGDGFFSSGIRPPVIIPHSPNVSGVGFSKKNDPHLIRNQEIRRNRIQGARSPNKSSIFLREPVRTDEMAHDPIIDEFADEFKRLGIEVPRGKLSPSELKELAKGDKPLFRPLKCFPIFDNNNNYSGDMKLWQEDFKSGAMGALAGIRGTPDTELSRTYFEQKWQNAPKCKRIFISYTGDDVEFAKNIKKVLDQQFTTFIFQNQDGKPLTTPGKAGAFFAEAGHLFVIICDKSLRSGGVIFEHLLSREF